MVDAKELENRLTRLERQNSFLRMAITAALAIAIIACTTLDSTATPGASTRLRTNLLQIVDANDNVIAELGPAGLIIRDAEERIRISLHHNDEDTGLYLLDEAGDSRVGIAHFAHGGSGVALHGAEVRGAAVLYYKTTGSLSFYDADNQVIQRVPERAQ